MNFVALVLSLSLWAVEPESEPSATPVPSPEPETILDFTITAPREPKREVAPQKLRPEELRSIPGTGGDPLRALQSLPGIATAGDFVSGLYARGGGPMDNLHLINRMPLPFPFHFGGLISTLNSNTLETVNLFPGGFTAEFGESTAAVLELETAAPRSDRWGAAAELNMVFSEGFLEGPLPWKGWGLSLAGRRSYFDLLIARVVDTGFTAFPKFGDYQLQLTGEGKGSRFDVLSFGSVDKLGLAVKNEEGLNTSGEGEVEFAYENIGSTQGARWHDWKGPLRLDFSAARSLNHFAFKGFGTTDFVAEWNFWSLRQDFSLDLGEAFTLEAGGESRWTFFPFSGMFKAITDEEQNQFQSINLTTVFVDKVSRTFLQQGYVQGRIKPGGKKLSLVLGARGSWQDATKDRTFQPRAALSWTPRESWKLFSSWGIYSRSPDPWYVDPDLGGNPSLSAEESRSGSLGLEKTWTLLSLRMEGYLKVQRKIIQSGTFPVLYENGGDGRGKGLEILIRRDLSQRWWGWLAYTLSRSERRRSGASPYFPYDYDQPHMATLILSGRLGRLWRLGTKIRYSSGSPHTPALGYDTVTNLVITGEKNSSRLPPYFRADVRLELREVTRKSIFSVYLELLNVTRRKNVQGYIYNTHKLEVETIYQIPFIPYLGIGVEF